MNEEQRANVASDESTFSRQVGAQAVRKLKARRRGPRSVWFGLGMSGLVGWSVTIPTLIGAALGMWVDDRYPSHVFMDADAALHRLDRRLSQCLEMGRTRNTRRCRRIRMSDALALTLAFLAGALLGVLFFGGLWWTVQKGVRSDTPALWFLGSLLLRTGLILVGFYVAAQGHWSRLAACLLGFVIARVIVVQATHTSAGGRADSIGRGDLYCALLPMTWSSAGTAFSSSIARSSRPGC